MDSITGVVYQLVCGLFLLWVTGLGFAALIGRTKMVTRYVHRSGSLIRDFSGWVINGFGQLVAALCSVFGGMISTKGKKKSH